jgi:hypothetical protein
MTMTMTTKKMRYNNGKALVMVIVTNMVQEHTVGDCVCGLYCHNDIAFYI